ncbi:MAG: DUF4136 domain-containing protein [Gammaproteobacteria bacterium]|nr:DUF4136 domain-containing protein [Gammaproteobacteria bacterium]
MKKSAFLLCTLVIFLAGCASSITKDIKIETDSDPKVNFDGYSSYTWLGSAAILFDPDGQWEPPQFDADAEIRFLIDSELRARGMTESMSSPDMIVFYGAGIDMANIEVQIEPESELEKYSSVPKGALAILLIDGRTQRAIWGGVATANVQQDLDQETSRKRLQYVIKTMFKDLPKK